MLVSHKSRLEWFLVALLIAAVGFGCSTKTADEAQELGDQASAAGDYQLAEEHYREALKVDGSRADIVDALSKLLAAQGRHDEGVALLEQTLVEYPEAIMVKYNLASSYISAERFADASNLLSEYVAVQPDHLDAWNNLGYSYLRLEQFSPALQAFLQTLRLNEDFSEGYYNSGIALFQMGRPDSAKTMFDRAMRLNPMKPEPHYYMGVLHMGDGEHEAAIKQLNSFLTVWKGSPTLAEQARVLVDSLQRELDKQ